MNELQRREIPTEALAKLFGQLNDCCLHQPAWQPENVTRVLASVEDGSEYNSPWIDCTVADGGIYKQGTESRSYTVVQLNDGRYGLLAESEDYTGHGCQCDSAALGYPTLLDLLRYGVDDAGARKAILASLVRLGVVQA